MKIVRQALSLLILFTVLTGLLYPSLVTVVAQQFFPWKANGSLLRANQTLIGSLLIGQPFTDPKYFWGRPGSEANLGPANPQLLQTVQKRVQLLLQSNLVLPAPPKNTTGISIPQTLSPDTAIGLESNANATPSEPKPLLTQNNPSQPVNIAPLFIPVDLVTDSASGIDPDISPQAAYYQIPRIAQARHISPEKLRFLVQTLTQKPTFGIFGQSRVNVLKLNVMLDNLK